MWWSEQHELFLDTADDGIRNHLQDVEPDSLAERSALAEHHNISFFNLETRGNVHWEVTMSLFESVILLDVV